MSWTIADKPGAESRVFVIDLRKFPIGDGNYRPIVVNIAQDLDKFNIVLDKIGSKKKEQISSPKWPVVLRKIVRILRQQAMK